ncbi:MAG: PIN domain-containing protein [Candidatus Binatia bacterium]|jgi:predicted nucleic acid-binding protein
MIFLLDSTAFSDLMRKDPRVEAQLAALSADDQVVICPIVRGEILYGLARLPPGRRREGLTKQTVSLFGTISPTSLFSGPE